MTNLILTDLENIQTLDDQQMAAVNGGFSTIFDVFRYIAAKREEILLKRKIKAYMATRPRARVPSRSLRRARRNRGE